MKNSDTLILDGELEAFWETGTEGVIWSFHEKGKEGYEGLHGLQKGDVLIVFKDAAREAVLWQGTVELEYERNYQPYPTNPKYGQQCVTLADGSGWWVHGFEKTMEPEVWAKMFFAELPAQLVTKMELDPAAWAAMSFATLPVQPKLDGPKP